jgi:hypothetical protein
LAGASGILAAFTRAASRFFGIHPEVPGRGREVHGSDRWEVASSAACSERYMDVLVARQMAADAL